MKLEVKAKKVLAGTEDLEAALEKAQARIKKLEKLLDAVDRQAKQAPDSISVSLRYALNKCKQED